MRVVVHGHPTNCWALTQNKLSERSLFKHSTVINTKVNNCNIQGFVILN